MKERVGAQGKGQEDMIQLGVQAMPRKGMLVKVLRVKVEG